MKYILLFFTLCPFLVSAGLKFLEPPQNDHEWGFRPASGEVCRTTPAPFVWKEQKNAVSYELQYARSIDFKNAHTVSGLRWNVHCPSRIMEPGTWFWRVRFTAGDGRRSEWSSVRKFEISADSARNPKPESAELLSRIPAEHPRIFIRPEQLPGFRRLAKGSLKAEYDRMIATCGKLLKNPPDTSEPPKYPDHVKRPSKEWRKLWWGNRMRVLKALGGAAELGYAWRISGDRRYGEAAKKILLECAKWDPKGSTAMRYNDEAGMPYLSRFSRTYSFVHDLLSEPERELCRSVIRIRGKEAFDMLYPRHFYQPYNSHKNRQWHFLGEAGVVFYKEIPEAADWIDGAMNVYYCVYPVWGDDDGGWHEGIWYWREYLDRFFWWADILHNTFGISIADKPFFSRTGDYGLYQMPPFTRGGGFGDLAHLERNQHALTMKSLASLSGNPYWQWYADRIGPAPKEVCYIEFLRASRPETASKAPAELPASRLFRGNGLAIFNTCLTDAAENTQILFKSSPSGGTTSHGYDANNSFLLNMGGERLLIRSGQRDNYGSNFHKNWMWETKSENNITVDGIGQKKMSRSAKGKITGFYTGKDVDYVSGEAAGSYGGRLRSFRRQILFLKPSVILVVDSLNAEKPSIFNWHLHALNKMEIRGQGDIRVRNGKANCRVEFLHPAGLRLSATDKFDPPPMPYLKLVQHHLTADTPEPSENGLFLTLIRPYRSGEEETVRQAATLLDTPGVYEILIPSAEKEIRVTVSKRDFSLRAEQGGRKLFPQ